MIYYLTALLNGFFNSINRMTNVRAGKLFGTANGALINYVEATVLSLLLVFVLKNGKELTWGYITAVPWWVYLGSVCVCSHSCCRSSGRCIPTRWSPPF